jgi:tetratricopeptide (TPR) repeat protein
MDVRYKIKNIYAVFISCSVNFFLLIFSHKNIKGNNRAVRYFNDSNFGAASENFSRELKRLPGNYSILNNAAVTEYKLNKFDEAQLKYNVVLNFLDVYQEEKIYSFVRLGEC